MQPSKPPKVIAADVVTAQPTEADSAAIAHLSAEASRALPQVVYVIKVQFKTKPPVSSQGWALYVGDFRIPKYWEYEHGVYFKVFASPRTGLTSSTPGKGCLRRPRRRLSPEESRAACRFKPRY
jgi:hypothetical protein